MLNTNLLDLCTDANKVFYNFLKCLFQHPVSSTFENSNALNCKQEIMLRYAPGFFVLLNQCLL